MGEALVIQKAQQRRSMPRFGCAGMDFGPHLHET